MWDVLKSRLKRISPGQRKQMITGVIVLVVGYYYFVGGTGFYKTFALKRQTYNLEQQIEFEKNRQDSLKILVEKLSHDLNTIEKVAREEYGMGKRDEIIIKMRAKK